MGDFLDNFKYIDGVIKYHLNGSTENVAFSDNILLRKPIGIGTKSYGFMEAMLHRNIGSHHFQYDGFGTTIGMQANPFLNSETDPWFFLDESKKKYDNYISYVNDMYFHGTMLPPNIQNTSNGSIQLNDYNAMLDEISRVGAIHHYDIDNIAGARMFIPNGSTNANGYDDTRLGVINNFYLSASLNNAYDKVLLRNTSSYHKPTYGRDDEVIDNSFSVTQGAYFKFGLRGEYGINNGTFGAREGVVTPQNLYTDDIIVWSTSDNYYSTNGNSEKIANMLGITMTDDMIDKGYGDSKRVDGYKSYPFGNFYSLSYSLGLLSASGSKTKEFITKSIYGIDLFSEFVPSLEYNEGDITTLKKISRKKYFASIGSRGTNYIDAMTAIDVEYENGDDGIIRLKLQDAGNDNLYTFNTFLTYSEAEGNKNPVKITTPVGNDGVNVGYFQTYDENILSKEDIISYTNRQFQQNKFKTIIGRLHTDSFKNANDARVQKDFTSSSVSQFGMSHGRNLLKKNYKNQKTASGFEDPYCRVWTYEKQYSRYSDLIRPFGNDELSQLDDVLKKTYQPFRDKLKEFGVKGENGLIRFVPEFKGNNITSCMFSIENLAWDFNLCTEMGYKYGPNGGRIMWFPPYGLTFQEQSRANWSSTQFLGRGEKIFSYIDTERTGSLSFQMLIDHPSLLNIVNNATDTIGDVDDVNSTEQQILRFFAGCDILSSQTPTINGVQEEVKEEETPTPIMKNGVIEQYHIEFEIFFPYKYSGENDDDWVNYLINGVGIEKYNSPTDTLMFIGEKDNTNKIIGGYEMESECGLSCTDEWAEVGDYENGVKLNRIYEQDNKGNVITRSLYTTGTTYISGVSEVWGYKIDESFHKKSGYEVNNIFWVFKNNENLKHKNYLDTKTYKLNNTKKEKKNEVENCLDVSFADMAIYFGCPCNANRKDKITSQNTQDLIKNIFQNYRVLKTSICGYGIDDEYAHGRVQSVRKWLGKKLRNCYRWETDYNNQNNKKYNDKQKVKLKNNINSKESKKARKVNVVITLERSIMDTNMTYFDDKNEIIIREAKRNNGNTPMNSMAQMALSNINEYEKKLSFISSQMQLSNNQSVNMPSSYNEYEFFQKIDKGDSFLRDKVLKKIKYFDPAYHSMTPEGFNSRLTFLHQCTRQGPTNSAMDSSGVNTRNLSFGKPPICVLRIGDFFNTKIVIDSVNIKYDDNSWDLNDEGIGVMPMMAQIDLSFSFIGGSELSNAVSILQNAVSFNYYANTIVYDKNAKEGDKQYGKIN